MTDRSVTHATFVVERRYDASPARVFAAWADPAAKARWFARGRAGASPPAAAEDDPNTDHRRLPCARCTRSWS